MKEDTTKTPEVIEAIDTEESLLQLLRQHFGNKRDVTVTITDGINVWCGKCNVNDLNITATDSGTIAQVQLTCGRETEYRKEEDNGTQ